MRNPNIYRPENVQRIQSNLQYRETTVVLLCQNALFKIKNSLPGKHFHIPREQLFFCSKTCKPWTAGLIKSSLRVIEDNSHRNWDDSKSQNNWRTDRKSVRQRLRHVAAVHNQGKVVTTEKKETYLHCVPSYQIEEVIEEHVNIHWWVLFAKRSTTI